MLQGRGRAAREWFEAGAALDAVSRRPVVLTYAEAGGYGVAH
jgi:hypothetical protein